MTEQEKPSKEAFDLKGTSVSKETSDLQEFSASKEISASNETSALKETFILEEALQKLSVNQQKYLFTLYQLQITGVKQQDIAKEIGVVKSTANRIIQELIELELIKQKNRYEISLSDKGERIAEQLDDQLTAIVQYLADDMDMDEELAARQSLDIALNMTAEYREACLKKIEKHQCRKPLPQNGKVKLQDVLKPGDYQVPFQLLHLKEDKTSMGDGGFQHPCVLHLQENGGYLQFALCDLSCKSIAGRSLSGRLKYLQYSIGDNWETADVTDTRCRIPADGMQLTLDSHGTLRTGELQVRVRASVGPFAMPESYARFKFNFRSCRLLKP